MILLSYTVDKNERILQIPSRVPLNDDASIYCDNYPYKYSANWTFNDGPLPPNVEVKKSGIKIVGAKIDNYGEYKCEGYLGSYVHFEAKLELIIYG